MRWKILNSFPFNLFPSLFSPFLPFPAVLGSVDGYYMHSCPPARSHADILFYYYINCDNKLFITYLSVFHKFLTIFTFYQNVNIIRGRTSIIITAFLSLDWTYLIFQYLYKRLSERKKKKKMSLSYKASNEIGVSDPLNLMWIRIRWSTSGKIGSDSASNLKPKKLQL